MYSKTCHSAVKIKPIFVAACRRWLVGQWCTHLGCVVALVGGRGRCIERPPPRLLQRRPWGGQGWRRRHGNGERPEVEDVDLAAGSKPPQTPPEPCRPPGYDPVNHCPPALMVHRDLGGNHRVYRPTKLSLTLAIVFNEIKLLLF